MTFGEQLRILMGHRDMAGKDLAAAIGVNPSSLSRIVNDKAKPRQVTLTRIIKVLCRNQEEEHALLRTFDSSHLDMPEAVPLPSEANIQVEQERVERWLEARTQAMLFRQAVVRELEGSGLLWKRDVCAGLASAELLIEYAGRRIALECKFNVHRDFEKTVDVARLLRRMLPCDQVIVVVPYQGPFVDALKTEAPAILVATPSELVALVKR
jgi:transcriptional regulator with XRE-family HTH domain